MKILIATSNKGKVNEFREIFSKYDIEVISLLDLDKKYDIIENGSTFEENAIIKSRTLYNNLNIPVIADDSGLCVKSLNNEPGIYSARYAGIEKDDKKNYELLLSNLIDKDNKEAYFVCVISLTINNKDYTFRGTLDGEITLLPKGDNGFGYDPVFYLKEYDKTLAQLDSVTKNKISHRAKAIEKLVKRVVIKDANIIIQ